MNHRKAAWPGRIPSWVAAALLHAAPLLLLLSAAPLQPAKQSGTFGQTVSVTLVSASAGRPQSGASPRAQTALSALADRLADPALPSSSNFRRGADGASLSDLMGPASSGAPSPTASRGPLTSSDDPFSRAFVSYRGDDPAKADALEARARTCTKSLGEPLRVLVILNAEGRLLGRPKPVAAADRDPAGLEKIILAVERCAPYVKAATPGAPRSYEIQIN